MKSSSHGTSAVGVAVLLIVVASLTLTVVTHHVVAQQETADNRNDPAQSVLEGSAESAEQFVFFAVLEGLYRDGVENADVEQILLRDGTGHVHFVYACPICTQTVRALQTYVGRPSFPGKGDPWTTFGTGLDPFLKKRLRSEVPKERLDVINTLVHRWSQHRLRSSRFSEAQKQQLQMEITEGVKRGRQILEASRGGGAAGIFSGGTDCAACVAAESATHRDH